MQEIQPDLKQMLSKDAIRKGFLSIVLYRVALFFEEMCLNLFKDACH